MPRAPDGAAWELAFRDHGRYVANLATRLMGRDDEVDDVVQDVFLAAGRGLAQLRDAGAVRGWLAKITVRCAIARLRWRRVRRLLSFDTGDPAHDLPAVIASPEDRALLAHVMTVLDRTPARYRAAWVLRTLEGHSLESTAALCGCSLATVKRWIHRVDAELARQP